MIKETPLNGLILAAKEIQEGETLLADVDEPGILLLHCHVNRFLEDVHNICQDACIIEDTLVCWMGLGGIVGQRAEFYQLVNNSRAEKEEENK